ncbi:MAG: hypothetical protein O2976_05715 [Actinomycetota bacterium]|nr:hypothetical protein [Actinomycetota bacterium]
MYVHAATRPQSLGVGVQARASEWKHDTDADWVAEMDVLPPGMTEITQAEYEQALADNAAHNAAIPPPPDPPPPDPDEAPLTAEEQKALRAMLRARP